MPRSNFDRFNAGGDWTAITDPDAVGLVRDVQALMESSLRCERLPDLGHVLVPEELRWVSDEFSPVELLSPALVSLVRFNGGGELVDFMGSAMAGGVVLSMLVTLRRGVDGRFVLWCPVSVVP